jgi:aryl carrier-like protein
VARQAGYAAELRWSPGRTDGAFDAVLRRAEPGAVVPAGQAPETGPPPVWSTYTNDPLFVSLRHRIAMELRELAAERLPDYMVPQAIVVLPSLPLTANGKVDRAALPAPAAERLFPEKTYLAPQTALETALTTTWANVLGLDKVGVHDNFFELGGDSIRAIQVAARIAAAGHDVQPRDLFSAQTVAELAAAIERRPEAVRTASPRRATDTPPFALAPVPRERLAQLVDSTSGIEDAYPLAPLQDHMLHQALRHPAPGLYVVHGVVPMLGRVEREPLARAWTYVVQRHPLLRTSFVWRDVPRPLQVVHRSAEPQVTVLDWRDRSPAEQDRAMADLLRDDRRRGHPPEQAPPLRVFGVQRSDDRYDLVISRDYVRLDGWSSRLYMGEFQVAYDAACAGEPLDGCLRKPPPPPYARYMSWLLEQPDEPSERFWRDSLGMDVPRSFVARPAGPASGGPGHAPTGNTQVWDLAGLHIRQATLDETATRSVVAAARRRRVTLNTIATAVWALTVSARTGMDDVVFGVASSGRASHVDGIEAMVGVFLNILPVRVPIPRRLAVAQWLRELSGQLVAMRDHEHVSLRDVERWARLAEDEPAFDCCLVFQNLPTLSAPSARVRDRRDSDLPQMVQMEFPLRIDMTHDGLIALLFTSHPARLPSAEADSLMADFMDLLAATPAALDGPVEGLLRTFRRER